MRSQIPLSKIATKKKKTPGKMLTFFLAGWGCWIGLC